jgi:hypothetical protein
MRLEITVSEKRRCLVIHFQKYDREFICNNTDSRGDGAAQPVYSLPMSNA